MGSHEGAEGARHSGCQVESTVLGQCKEQVLGQLVHLELVAGTRKAIGLQGLLNGRVGQEVAETGIFLQHIVERLQILLNGLKVLLFGGCGVKGGGIAAFDAVDLNWRLNQLETADRGGKSTGENSQVTAKKKQSCQHRENWGENGQNSLDSHGSRVQEGFSMAEGCFTPKARLSSQFLGEQLKNMAD